MKIITGKDNKVLRAVSGEIKSINSDIKRLIKKMKQTLALAKGLGLAAPQVGHNVRVFIVILNYNKKDEKSLAMINPKIISQSKETEIMEEGCLSVPGIYGDVSRSSEITVSYQTEKKQEHTLKLSNLNAREFLHEYDHLEGILFTDKLVKN